MGNSEAYKRNYPRIFGDRVQDRQETREETPQAPKEQTYQMGQLQAAYEREEERQRRAMRAAEKLAATGGDSYEGLREIRLPESIKLESGLYEGFQKLSAKQVEVTQVEVTQVELEQIANEALNRIIIIPATLKQTPAPTPRPSVTWEQALAEYLTLYERLPASERATNNVLRVLRRRAARLQPAGYGLFEPSDAEDEAEDHPKEL